MSAVAHAGERVVGGATLQFPLQDNPDRCYAELWVVPELRRRGHGTVLLQWVIEQVERAGRSLLTIWSSWGLDGSGNTSQAFLHRHGFTDELLEAHRVLDLPLRHALPAAPVAPGYSLVFWTDRCPDEHVVQYARLRALLAVEAPSGEHALQEEAFDPARIRLEEAELAAAGRRAQSTAAVGRDGSLVGHTQLIIPAEDPLNAHQWDTLVVPGHRGHGLGLALKVANLRAAGPAVVGRTAIHTWNAANNSHMIRVNELLGYRLASYSMEMTKVLGQ